MTPQERESLMGGPPKMRKKIDTALASDLIKDGYPPSRIAKVLGCSKSCVERLKRRIISQALDNQNTQSL